MARWEIASHLREEGEGVERGIEDLRCKGWGGRGGVKVSMLEVQDFI